MSTYMPPPQPFDQMASKIQFTWPEGDANIVESRQTVKWRSDAPYYLPGSVAKLWIYSNGQSIDLANSYFLCNFTISLSGSNVPQINQYDQIKPLLKNGFEDLIAEWRVKSYGGVDMEYIRRYNYINALRHWTQIPRENSRALARLTLQGDCLNPSEKFKIIDINNDGKSLGIKVAFRPESSGFFDTKRLLPLRYMNQVQFEITWEKFEQAFFLQAGFFPSGVTDSSTVTAPSGSYCVSNLEFVADMLTLSPEMETALEKAVNEKDGIPLFFDTWEIQMDNIGTQGSYNQKIGKAVANAVRAMSTLQPFYAQNNAFVDSFASEPMGLADYQYRLGTAFYPKDKVDLRKGEKIRAVIEADKAMGFPLARRESPPSNVLEQIGADAWFNALSTIQPVGTFAHYQNSSAKAQQVSILNQAFSANQYFPPWAQLGNSTLRKTIKTASEVSAANVLAGVNEITCATTTGLGSYLAGSLADAAGPSHHVVGTLLANHSGSMTMAVGSATANANSTAFDCGVMTGPVNSNRSQAVADVCGLISNHGYGSPLDKESNYQLYLPYKAAIPSKFRIGTSLQMSPDAWVTGVSLNHGHQLELAITRFNAPSLNYPWLLGYISSMYPLDNAIFTIAPATGTNGIFTTPLTALGTTTGTLASVGIPPSQIAKAPTTGTWTGQDPAHGSLTSLNSIPMRGLYASATLQPSTQKNSSVYSWGTQDSAWLITYLQYTRLILIKKDYNIQIRE